MQSSWRSLLVVTLVACHADPDRTPIVSREAPAKDAAVPDVGAPEGGATPSLDRPPAQEAVADAGDAAPPEGGSRTPLTLPAGRFSAKGPWGVHRTGTLVIEMSDAACTARYTSEGSYFCVEKHSLACRRTLAGADIALVSCITGCSRPDADHSDTACGAEDRFHGTIVPGETPEELEFRLDADYLTLMRRWNPKYPTERLRLKRTSK